MTKTNSSDHRPPVAMVLTGSLSVTAWISSCVTSSKPQLAAERTRPALSRLEKLLSRSALHRESEPITVSRAVDPEAPVDSHPDLVDDLDYEAELAVIVGKDALNVAESDAESYIFGYTILNDISARTLQRTHKQWYRGKSLDGFTPMGPWIVTADEIPYPPVLDIGTRVNGQLRQNSSTGCLIHGVGEILSEISAGMTLRAGSVIATGTPAGVAMGMAQPKYLRAGDVVECFIQGIGTLRNPVK